MTSTLDRPHFLTPLYSFVDTKYNINTINYNILNVRKYTRAIRIENGQTKAIKNVIL